jgi:hypothetical protein
MIRDLYELYHTSLDGENNISQSSALLHSVIKLRLCYCFENATSGGEKLHIVALRLNHWGHMDYFNDVFTTFLGLESGNNIAVTGGQKGLRFHKKYLHLCSKNERRSYWFGTT